MIPPNYSQQKRYSNQEPHENYNFGQATGAHHGGHHEAMGQNVHNNSNSGGGMPSGSTTQIKGNPLNYKFNIEDQRQLRSRQNSDMDSMSTNSMNMNKVGMMNQAPGANKYYIPNPNSMEYNGTNNIYNKDQFGGNNGSNSRESGIYH